MPPKPDPKGADTSSDNALPTIPKAELRQVLKTLLAAEAGDVQQRADELDKWERRSVFERLKASGAFTRSTSEVHWKVVKDGLRKDFPRMKLTSATPERLLDIYQKVAQSIVKNDTVSSGAVGALGFTYENARKAEEISPTEAIKYIEEHLLSGRGRQIAKEYRRKRESRQSVDQEKREAGEMIRKIRFTEADAGFHAVGLANDACLLTYREGKQQDMAYKEIARTLDGICSEAKSLQGDMVSYCRGLLNGEPTPAPPSLNREQKLTLHSFAAIQCVEMARLRHIEKTHLKKPLGENLVLTALDRAAAHGFREVYSKNAKKYAIFAQKGGVAALKKHLESVVHATPPQGGQPSLAGVPLRNSVSFQKSVQMVDEAQRKRDRATDVHPRPKTPVAKREGTRDTKEKAAEYLHKRKRK